MIRAAAKLGERAGQQRPDGTQGADEMETPAELRIGLQCERWGKLWRSGGLEDQPLPLFLRIDVLLSVYHAHRAWAGRRAGHEREWKLDHPAEWRVITWVRKLGKVGSNG